MHARQLKAVMGALQSFFVATDVGSITNRFSQDISMVDTLLPITILNFVSFVYMVANGTGFMIAATPPVAALVPMLLAVPYLIQRVYVRTSRQIRLMDLEATAPLCTHFLETVAGATTVRAFGWKEEYKQKNNVLIDASQVPFFLLLSIQNWLRLVLELMVAGVVIVLVSVATALRSKMDPGLVGLALIGAMSLGQQTTYLSIGGWFSKLI